MSILTSGLADPSNAPPPSAPQRGSVLGEAFQNGLRNAGAGLSALGGTALDAVGAQGAAQSAYNTSQGLRAAVTTPTVNSYNQVNSVDTALQYATNLVGESVPTLAAGLAGAVATRNPLVGATLATAPLAAGDVAVRQQEDPNIAGLSAGRRLAEASGTGLATAALGNIVPVALGGKLLGRGIEQGAMSFGRNAATNLAEAVGGNSAAGALGEYTTQGSLNRLNPNRDQSGDTAALKEAAVGGAVSGLPFAIAGTAGQALHGKGAAPRTDGVPIDANPAAEQARGGLPEAPGAADAVRTTPTPDQTIPTPAAPSRPLAERFRDAFTKKPGEDDAATIAEGKDVIDADALTSAAPEQQGIMLADADAKRTSTVSDWAKQLLGDKSLSEDNQAKLQSAVGDLSDRANQATVAGIKMAADAGTKATSMAQDFLDMATKKYDEVTKGKNLSDTTTPEVHAQIEDVAKPAMADTFPALFDTPAAAKAVTNGLRKTMSVMAETGTVDSDTVRQLHSWFGDKAGDVMADLHGKVLGSADKAQTAKYFDAVNDLASGAQAETSLTDRVRNALSPEQQKTATPEQLKAVVSNLREYVAGEHTKDMPKSQADFTNKQIDGALREQFGGKTDALLEAVRKDSDKQKLVQDRGVVEADPEQGINTKDGADVAAEAEPVQYLGGGNKGDAIPRLIPSKEAHDAVHNNVGAAERLLEQAQLDNPDRVVEFTKVKDLPEEQRAKYPNAGPDDGLVTIGGTKSETALTPAEFQSMRVDTSKTSHAQNNASRIDTGVRGAVIDARAIVKQMQGKLDYNGSDNIGKNQRTARAFMEGIAAVQDHLGKTFEIPDTTVLDGNGLTYGEAKKLSMREPDPAWMKGKTDEEINSELNRKDALKDMSDRELDRATIRSQDVLAKREAALSDAIKGKRMDAAAIRELRKSMGVDDARAAVHAAEAEASGRADEVRRAQNNDDAGRTEVGSDEQIHTAADGNTPKDLQRKTGLDDNALSTTNFEPRKPDGSLKNSTINAISTKINRLENFTKGDGSPNMIARRVGVKARELFDKFGQMKLQDQALLSSIVKDGKISSIADTINELSDKYKGVEAAPKKLSAFVEHVLGEGDLAPVIKQIKDTGDLRGVQRAIDALGEHVGNPRADQVLAAANERISKILEGKDSEGVSYNMQRAGAKEVSPKLRADVEAHISKVLGPDVQVQFDRMLHEGEFIGKNNPGTMNPSDIIKISVHSQDPMSTAYHESMHGFFESLKRDGQGEGAKVLFKAADSPEMIAKLNKLLAGEPDALKQVASSSEERAAYMYQFWEHGLLDVGTKPSGVLGTIGAFFRKVLGMWTNDERATNIMEYFGSGEYAKQAADRSAVARSLNEGTLSADHFKKQVERLGTFVGPLDTLASRVISTGDANIRGFKNAALDELLNKVYSPLQGAHDDPGYIPAARVKRTQVLNDLAKDLHGFDPAVVTDALASMQKGEKGSTPAERQVVIRVRKTLDSMYEYMTGAGVKLNDAGFKKDYFPRVWDTNKVLSNEKGFRDMLQQYKDAGKFNGSIDQIMASLTRGDGSELTVETAKPGMQFSKERVLGFIRGEDAQPFLNDNLYQTLNSYVTQGTRRAEWASRFGDDGAGLKKTFEDARKQGATEDQILQATKYLKGVDGTLGDTIDPALRRAFGNMMVYQNVRLLPLALFSSLIDPLGIAVRGGTAGEAWGAFKRGIKEIPQGFKSVANRAPDEWTHIAATMGTIDSAVLMHTLGTSYSQGMTSDFGRKVNDTFFKYNLMEQYNVSMRVAATEAASSFIGRHADGTASAHSARWLAELGLKTSDVELGKDGRPLLSFDQFKKAGVPDDVAQFKADRMALAINKWVDGAVLRPNAAHKPIWMNDPHFALVSHLKQFVYSFQETILKRVASEFKHGNLGPAYALASYVPFMIAADLVKGIVVGGGQQPDYKEGWDAGDYVWSGLQRAGLFGVGQFGIDAIKGLERGGTGVGGLAGPTLEQFGDAASVVAGPQQFQTFALNALPANQLFDAANEATSTNAAD